MPVAEAEAVIAQEELTHEELSVEVPPDDAADENEEALTNVSHVEDAPDAIDSDVTSAEPLEIPTSDEELEQLEIQDRGRPDDDVAPPMNDPGPMEPPFTEPDDLTPIDPDPGPPDSDAVPGPNPDEAEGPAGPVE